jgi:putative PEP-CTERM system TPR-repeat lipoprotein
MKAIRLLLWIALALASASCGGDSPTQLVASAKEYLAKREYNAAVIQLKNALQKEPDDAEARYLLGLASLESGDVLSAETELKKAEELGLRSGNLDVAQARTLLAKGDAKGAISRYAGKTLSDAQIQADLHAVLGLAQLAVNNPSEAGKRFEQSLAIAPANVTANLGQARLLAAKGEFEQALKHVAQALSSSPSSGEAHLLKADLLATKGDAQAAEAAYRDAIRIAPGRTEPRLGLIAHLVRQRALEKAQSELAELEKTASKDPRVAYARAQLELAQHKFAAARETIQQVLKVAPEHVPSLTLAGIAAFRDSAYAEAESHLRKAVGLAPQAIEAKRYLAATRLRLGETDQALKEVQQLLSAKGDDPTIHMLAGEAYLASGDVAAAARYYEKAKALQPGNAKLQTRLAQIRFAAGDSDKGFKELEAAAAGSSDDYQADLALIAAHLRERQADKALEAVMTLERKQPENPVTHQLRGLALLIKADAAAARKSFERAVELRPNYMPAISALARMDLREKKPVAARKRYEAVLQKDPGNEQAILGLAVLLRITGGDPKDIEKLLKDAVTNNLTSANARVALVNFYLRQRNTEGALAAAREAQATLPSDPAVNNALGTAQLAAGDFLQAVASFTRLAKLVPQSPQAQLQLARAHEAAKQPDEALRALRAALELKPDLGEAYRGIVRIYLGSGRTQEALRTARDVQTKQPSNPIGYILEAEVYAAQKDLGSAERTYKAALKRFDDPVLAVRTHAVLAAASKQKEADEFAEDWIKRHPADTVVLSYLAERDIAAKRYSSAVVRYRSALEKQPDNAGYLNNLAWAANELKEPRALQYAERAHELAPSNPAIMDTLGWILVQRGERERGLEMLGRATELAPDAHDIRLRFAKSLVDAGRKGAARKELEQLSRIDSRHPAQKEAAALLAGL